jgi:hypothetical protein
MRLLQGGLWEDPSAVFKGKPSQATLPFRLPDSDDAQLVIAYRLETQPCQLRLYPQPIIYSLHFRLARYPTHLRQSPARGETRGRSSRPGSEGVDVDVPRGR